MATIEIDGKIIEVDNGKMIIEVADEAGIVIPRFCYHKKLSVAANCRMCLVEVENNRKTLPACATPITDGMKIFTKSKEAIRSQQAVMEFLLINHPLDCPICDQGGECELQDVSMGFGRDTSTYEESKRTVADEDIGPLIATEMTRCIHCTRCVRFGDEIAGLRELGATGRGENTTIGTYVKHSITSELSGNVIDLCPVGALTSKPYRYTARAWEMTQHATIAPHDCIGSNVYVHVRRNRLMRAVPKENANINEMWLSDRDRFSYLGMINSNRLESPQIKRDGQWELVDWQTALQHTAKILAKVVHDHGPEQFAAFASSSATLEELYLMQKWMRELGIQNLDHRLQQTDFGDQDRLATMPGSSLAYAELEKQATFLLIGAHLHRETPVASVRIRKAVLNGAQAFAINPVDYDYRFEIASKITVTPDDMLLAVAKVIAALTDDVSILPESMRSWMLNIRADHTSEIIAKALCQPNAVIVTGSICENHPRASHMRALVTILANLSGASVLRLTVGANAAGAWLAGMLPHRSAASKVMTSVGLNVQAALAAKLKGYLLMGVNPDYDFANPLQTRQAMSNAECVIVMTAYQNEAMKEYADVILPIAPYTETSGTYINVDLTWQTVQGALQPYAEARPAWKIIRVLANLLHCSGFDYTSTDDVLSEIKVCMNMSTSLEYAPIYPDALPAKVDHLVRVGEWPIYRCDDIVRHSQELQMCATAESACIKVHPSTAIRLNLGSIATVSQGDIEVTLPLVQDERIALNVVWVANALPETVDLGNAFGAIELKGLVNE